MTRGVDDRQAVVTFAKPYAEWRGMFAGNTMLLPKSMTANPEVFNKGQLDGPGPVGRTVHHHVAGPDRAANHVDPQPEMVGHTAAAGLASPTWCSTTPPRIPALQNNTIDATGLTSLHELTTARRHRRASRSGVRPAPSWYHFTFNGAPGSILADKALRLAVAKGIDRQAIANVTQRGLVNNPVPLNNHIFVAGQEGYQDNSEVVAFDPEKAKQELDALGWRLNGQFREKDGRQLVIRDVLYDAETTRQVGQIAQNSLAQIGVKLELDAKGGGGFFTNYIIPGDFDIAQFTWVGDAFSLCCLNQIYTTNAESNFGKISSPEIDAKAEQTFDELDPAKARELANELDKLIFADGIQPAAVPVGRQCRRAQQPGELRPGRHRRPGLHQDRVHEVTRRTTLGTTAGRADSTAAAVPIAPTNSRIPSPAGFASSSFPRAGRRPVSPSYTAPTISSAARSRTSMALWPAVGQLDEHRVGNQRHDFLGDRARGDQVAATRDDDGRPAELRHLRGEIVGLGFEFHWLRGDLAERDGRVQRLTVGYRTVVEFTKSDPADQVGLVAIGRLAVEQKSRGLIEHRPQPASAAQKQVELAGQHRRSGEAVDLRGELPGRGGEHARRRPTSAPWAPVPRSRDLRRPTAPAGWRRARRRCRGPTAPASREPLRAPDPGDAHRNPLPDRCRTTCRR